MKAGNKEKEEVQEATQNQKEMEEEKEVSNISKTQDAAVDSQTGAAKMLRSILKVRGEDRKSPPHPGMVTDNQPAQSHWGYGQ